jgi:hypothetical protein
MASATTDGNEASGTSPTLAGLKLVLGSRSCLHTLAPTHKINGQRGQLSNCCMASKHTLVTFGQYCWNVAVLGKQDIKVTVDDSHSLVWKMTKCHGSVRPWEGAHDAASSNVFNTVVSIEAPGIMSLQNTDLQRRGHGQMGRMLFLQCSC